MDIEITMADLLERETEYLETDLYAKDNIINLFVDYLEKYNSEDLSELLEFEMKSDTLDKFNPIIKRIAEKLVSKEFILKFMEFLNTREIEGGDEETIERIHHTDVTDFLGICYAGGLFAYNSEPKVSKKLNNITTPKFMDEVAEIEMLHGFSELLQTALLHIKINHDLTQIYLKNTNKK